MPSFGASDLFGGGDAGGDAGAPAMGPAPAAAPAAAPAMAPMGPADPFAGGAQWSMPKPEPSSGGGGKGIYIAVGVIGFLVVAGLATVVAILLLRDPKPLVVAQQGQVNEEPKPAGTEVKDPAGQPAAGAEATKPSAAAAEVEPSKPAETVKPARPNNRPTGRSTRRPTSRPPSKTTPRKNNSGGMDDLLNNNAPARKPTKKSLDKNDIMSGVKKGMGAVMGCIKTARAKGELTSGRHTLVLEWTIQPNGRVANPRLKGPSSVLGTSLPACFARGMRKWTFPASEKGGPVRNFPFGPFSIK